MRHANVSFFVPMAGCPHRCSFCDQQSITGETKCPTPEEVDACCAKAAEALAGFSSESEIAFFGGSFTMIPRETMVSLLEPAAKWVERGAFSGIRCSTRPDAIDEEILDLLARYHVRSIELGAQSSSDDVLAANGRGHTFSDTQRASALIRERGFSLGLQMMTGLPADTPELDLRTAEDFIRLRPETMRIYPALVLDHTPMAALWREGGYRPQTIEEAALLCAELLDLFEEAGIRVIRVGLHAEPSLEKNLLAGPYHPAFREIAESLRFYKKITPEILKYPEGALTVFVNPSEQSKAAGQKCANLSRWKEAGCDVRILGDPSLPCGTFRICPSETTMIRK
ncbi:MAG TPA: radical SAM protein [Oscillospiraceae bacterium]|nr:radical SAM protein [Oscillospiraceae bacterium]HRW56915.1 radical SAM protein [Oscillospiraceae bacterium]